jgi:O-methyltransferase
MRSLISQDRLDNIRRLVKQTCPLDGEMAEFGVFEGGSARVIAEACNKPLHLFDTFEGMPEDDVYPEGHKKDDFAVTYEEVRAFLSGLNVIYHPGFFPDTTRGLEHLRFSFVHIDADIEQSTRAGIEFFKPRMVSGGVIVFDDYGWKNCPAVKKLVDENFEIVNSLYQAHVIL